MTNNFREQADPWTVKIIDLESLNQPVTDAIVREVRGICEQSQKGAPPATLPARLILGTPGVGKTHLFSRLRNQVLQRQHRVSLIYIRPSLGAPQTPRLLLGQLFEQLRMPLGPKSQIDLLIGAILALVGGHKHTFPNAYLAELDSMLPAERDQLLDGALEILLERNPSLEGSADYLEALLHIPFRENGRERRAWLGWLEGREVDPPQAERFRLPPPLTEDRLLPALQTLATVAAPASPLLLVFDQLENLVDNNDQEPRIKAYARLVMELVDTVPGLVVVQMAVSQDWGHSIAPHIEGAPRSRLSVDASSPRHTILALPSAEQRRALVDLWRSQLDPPPPQPSPWPFSARHMEDFCNQPGLTPRMLLLFFQEALAIGDTDGPLSQPSSEPSLDELAAARAEHLASAWRDQLAEARQRLFEADEEKREINPVYLLDGLLGLASLSPSISLAQDPRETEIEEKSSGRRLVLVLGNSGQSVAPQLNRLRERRHKITPVLALRERWRPIPDSWKRAVEYRRELEKKNILRWRWLEREEAAELLALRSFLMALRSHDVNGPDGKPVPQEEALAWLRSLPEPPLARLLSWLQSGEEILEGSALTPVPPPAASGKEAPPRPEVSAPTSTPTPPAAAPPGAVVAPPTASPPSVTSSATASPVAASPVAAVSPVEVAMARLRVASLDRLVRELRGEKVWRRAEVRKAVEDSGGRLRLLGSSLVVVREEVLS